MLATAFTAGTFANTTAPMIGSATLAALLKNSRRDWSFSFLSVFIAITFINFPYILSVGDSVFSIIIVAYIQKIIWRYFVIAWLKVFPF